MTEMNDKIRKSEAAWRAELSPEAFEVTRRGGTEPPFSGRYYGHEAPGLYRCVCCGAPLFDSEHKYESGSGWPSYWQPVDEHALEEQADHRLGMKRVEVRCRRCDAHLGHVFNDGPWPTGLRYCINSAALRFEPRETSPGHGGT